MRLFGNFTWIILLGYCFYITVKETTKQKNPNPLIRKLEIILYLITGIIGIVLFDMFSTKILSEEILIILVPICVVLQLFIIVTIQYLEIKNEKEKEIWKNKIVKNFIAIIFWLVIFMWMLKGPE